MNLILAGLCGISILIEKIVGTGDINANIDESKKDFTAEGEISEVSIPKDGGSEVVLESFGEEIAMELPKEVADTDGVITEKGTVVHNSDEDVTVSVQAIQEQQGDLFIEGVRSVVTIEDADAPREYSFNYDLPKGYEIVRSEDYYADEDAEKGWIYIIDNNSIFIDEETGESFAEIMAAIEPAWAKDAKGESINTYYKIKGSELIQVVDFDEESAFPIVADPSTSTKPASILQWSKGAGFSINHNAIGFASWSATVAATFMKKEIKEKITDIIVAKVGVRVIPVFSYVTLAIDGYCAIQGLRGYDYTKGSFICQKWKVYKRQASKWVAGYSYKVSNLSIWAE